MTTKTEPPVYTVFLCNGPFCDETTENIRLEGVQPDELNVLLSIAGRQPYIDIVVRYYAQEVSE